MSSKPACPGAGHPSPVLPGDGPSPALVSGLIIIITGEDKAHLFSPLSSSTSPGFPDFLSVSPLLIANY